MLARRQTRRTFQLEMLDDRIAPSAVIILPGGGLVNIPVNVNVEDVNVGVCVAANVIADQSPITIECPVGEE